MALAKTATAKCKKCKKQSTFHVDHAAPVGQHADGQATVWQCPHCGTTNIYEHKD